MAGETIGGKGKATRPPPGPSSAAEQYLEAAAERQRATIPGERSKSESNKSATANNLRNLRRLGPDDQSSQS